MPKVKKIRFKIYALGLVLYIIFSFILIVSFKVSKAFVDFCKIAVFSFLLELTFILKAFVFLLITVLVFLSKYFNSYEGIIKSSKDKIEKVFEYVPKYLAFLKLLFIFALFS